MTKRRMGGASVWVVKCENAGEVTVYVVDQDIDVRKGSTAMWYKLLRLAS